MSACWIDGSLCFESTFDGNLSVVFSISFEKF